MASDPRTTEKSDVIEPPYGVILNRWRRGKVVPFLGAGASFVGRPADVKDIANSVPWWQHGSPEPVATKPNELDIDLSKTSVIYKMHGTIVPETEKWDSFVITEEDYVEFLSRMTTNTAIPSLFYPH